MYANYLYYKWKACRNGALIMSILSHKRGNTSPVTKRMTLHMQWVLLSTTTVGYPIEGTMDTHPVIWRLELNIAKTWPNSYA